MEKIDLVYILGLGSKWADNEIRYSVRSAEKYFKHLGNIYIIGEYPEWMTKAIHILARDSHSNKIQNARAKYLIATKDSRISKNFVLMNDDFFFIKEVDEIPNYSRGTLSEMIERHATKTGYYYASLAHTRDKLDAMGISDGMDFEVHAPMIFNKEKLEQTIGMIGEDRVYSLRSCYGNLMQLEPKVVMDFKAANASEFSVQKSRGAEFLSINDALVFWDYFREWLQKKYPDVSRFEVDEGKGIETKPGKRLSKFEPFATKNFTYGSKEFRRGEMIDQTTFDGIKHNQKMRALWDYH